MRLVLTSTLLVAAIAAGCDRKPPPPARDDAETVRIAKAKLAPYKSGLKAELESALARSPAEAIDVCAARGPELARQHGGQGALVGRSAKRLRNPANAPPAWLRPVMDRLATAPSGSDAHEVVALDGGRRGYAEAIWTGAVCTTCHGASVAPELAAKIDARYPADGARGFALGDFRGVFWVELDAPRDPR